MRANLAIFKDIFGGEFFSHVILVFTRWGYDPRSIRDRERDGEYEHRWNYDPRSIRDREQDGEC